MDKKLAALAEEIEAALVIEDDLAERVLAALGALSDRRFAKADLESTDAILDLVYALKPGWNVSIRGIASKPNGHWRCTLRRSASRDNDEYIGIARGPTLPHAFRASLLKAISLSPR